MSRRIRPLTARELAAYDVIRAELAARVRLIRIPMPGPYDAMTLGRFILVGKDLPTDGTSRLLAHELVHVRQWAELGLVGFLSRYLSQFARGLIETRSWRRAYLGLEAEQEARAEAGRWYSQLRPGPH